MSEDGGAPVVEPPTRCPCGHPICDDYRCINGRIYGPCESEFCGGVCDDNYGRC